jgi:hypothetical protein
MVFGSNIISYIQLPRWIVDVGVSPDFLSVPVNFWVNLHTKTFCLLSKLLLNFSKFFGLVLFSLQKCLVDSLLKQKDRECII